jgi:DNA repair protein SbcC/Rad50
MIPLRLSLRNFMCYRENVPALNFESIHTACISGNNGNGKSALIDAITWALWGETRATSDDDLIYSGQSEVTVEFDFAVGKQRYRIIRKHSRPKTQKSSGQTILEFQAETPEGYKVLSGDTTTQTQQKIIQVLHMDYDTFINSAFLKQGHADEFTRKAPNQRKQVLANIMQLSAYDDLEEKAKEKVKEQENQISQIEAAIGGIKEELARKPEYQAEFEKAQSDLIEADKLAEGQQVILNKLREDKKILDGKTTQLAELTAHLQDSEKNFNLWKEQSRQFQTRIQSYETLISQRETIERNYNQFIEARKQNQELDQKLKQLNTLTQGKHKLEMIILKAGEELNRSHAVTENHITELEKVSRNLNPVQEEIKKVAAQLKTLDEGENKLREKRETAKTQRGKVHFLEAEKVRLHNEIIQIEEKIKMLSHQEGANCPLCESELGPEGQKRIEAKYQAEKAAKTESLKATNLELASLTNETKILEAEIFQLENRLKQARETTQNKAGILNKALSDAQEAEQKILIEKNNLNELEQRMAKRDFAVNELNALSKIEMEIKEIAYDAQRHETARTQLASLEKSEIPKHKLEEAERLIIQERESETRALQTVQELQIKVESDKQRRLTLLAEIAATSRVAGDLMLAENEYRGILSRQKQIQEVMGGARAKLERLTDLEIKNKEKDNLLIEAGKQSKIYKDLAQAFGKKGIQAMLIEMAIPEIENEANRLLARMTDNRMTIKMETQRETKKGDVMETLDINIADELGTRNYEMFSGGEAFRIDFAVRIALSRLLARRAGAPLPTLIIDEGFGTQDSTGIEKIKEAITSIQDDFEKILVITHIADFKDAFPARIEVVKTAEGSTVYLN